MLDRLRHAGRRRSGLPGHVQLGQRGEDLAHRFVESMLGWQVISRNYESKGRRHEIDMIALERDTLVVAEIKTRSSDETSDPIRAIDLDKEHRITHAAQDWTRKAAEAGMTIRFDAITVILSNPIRIEHHRDAFRPRQAAI